MKKNVLYFTNAEELAIGGKYVNFPIYGREFTNDGI